MTDHQAAIFEESHAHHLYLEFEIPVVTGALPGVDLLTRPVSRVYETFAFSEKVLDGIDHRLAPAELKPFETIIGQDDKVAPATQHDICVWIQSNQRDEVFARGLAWTQVLADVAQLKLEEHGFLFRDNRDLTGFIDGTSNPQEKERQAVALIPTGAHAGGSYVLTQRWLHDLTAFNAQEVEEQERVIGRTKKSSFELDEEHMPPDSHVSRAELDHEGSEVKIYRRSTPTGGMKNAGLYFLAFSAEPQRFTWILESMLGKTKDGLRDRLLTFTKPLTGSFYFAPNLQALHRIFA
ncbi:MAG: Dyp-type peroxidase [Gammaproteobacteria bacterium]|nr:Dyp-type peroxidase [Gammaproteobacteria bacterium]